MNSLHTYAIKKIRRSIVPAVTLGCAAVFVLAGCGSSGHQSADKMTSYTSANSGTEATLFTVPQDQLSHIQIVTISA
ncbi:MAG: hypothetical protein ACRD37_01735, partial [Candidatus Acidiferrales bacterium]